MLNQVILVGRVSTKPSIYELEGNKVVVLTLEVQKSVRNKDGYYDNDLIPVTLYSDIGKSAIDFVEVGNLIGVKGVVERHNDNIKIIGTKLSYLSSKSNSNNNN